MNIETIKQGKVVIEHDGIGYLVMFPDGYMKGYARKSNALKAANKWFKDALGDEGWKVGIGTIEWRTV